MKKLLIMACTMCILGGTANAAINNIPEKAGINKQNPQVERKAPDMEQVKRIRKAHENAFEQKLGLTEVQKLKARELRKTGHEKIKPVMDEIKANKKEAEAVRNSKLTVEAQEEKLIVIDKNLAELEKQAQTIRKQNMKDFESILTKDQKKILKNMKKEGRKNFDKNRKQLPPPPCKPIEKK